MRKMKKKSFDWYGARQRFSIRKYHVGAVSVFLGMSLVLGAGAQIAHAEGSIDTSETPTSVSATEGTSSSEQLPTESLLVSETEEETVIDGQTVSSQDRIATLNYIVQYVLEDGTLVTASVRTATINTTLEIAKTTLPVYLEIPEGYELASGQPVAINQEIVENGQNVVTIKVAKKAAPVQAAPAVAEKTAETSEVTERPITETANSIAAPTSKGDETTEQAVPAVSIPVLVEEAKVVLEQVVSEAQLLTNEAERLVATDSENESLKAVAVATRLSVSDASLVLNNSAAKLEAVNYQIDTVRSTVEALVLELRKYSENGDIVVLLAADASTTGNLTAGTVNEGPNSDFPLVTTSGQGAYKEGRTTKAEVDIPAGASVGRPVFEETAVYKIDPTEGRYTFLVSNLDPYKHANGNPRDLYMTVSRDLADETAQTVYVRIVDKATQEVLGTTEVPLGAASLALNGRPENVKFLYVQNGQSLEIPINLTVSYQKVEYAGQLLPRLEFYFGSTSYDQFKTTAVWQSNGLTQGLGATVHKLWSYTPQLSTNVTSYLVQGTDELIATYKVTGYEGDNFVSSGKRNFANYEYVSGQPESGILGIDYKVGDQIITTQRGGNGLTERRVKTIVSEDGDMVITLQYKKTTEADSEYKTFFDTGVLDNLTYGYVAPDTRKYAVEGFGDDSATVSGRTSVYVGRVARWNLYNELNPSKAEVFYYYVQKGSVEVFYVDEIGNPIQASKLAVAHGDTGSDYSTVSLRDEKIVGNNGITYYYKQIDGVGADGVFAPTTRTDDERTVEEITAETGTVARNTVKELTYVYEQAGSVNVNYVDVNGKKLSGTDGAGKVVTEKVADLVDAKPGTQYDTILDNRPAKIVTADGKTYELAPPAEYTVGTVEADHHLSVSNVAEVTGVHEATGSVASGITKEITYVYKEVTGKVIVNFKSIDGEVLQGPRTDTEEGSTGRDYNTEGEGEVPPTITKDGKTYKLVPNLTNGNPTGKVTPGTTEVTYYYQLVTGDVVVNYENTDGKTIAPQKVDVNNGNIGDAYDTRDEGDKPEKIVEDGTGDVYYIKPAGTEVKTGDGLSGETGRVVEGTTQVTYIYEKAGNVKINYILDDAAGTTLKDSVMDEENAKPGTAYDTTDEGDKPETISKDGKLYRLKEVKADSAAENGDTAKIAAGETLEVTYVYTEVKSDVVVEYYDTEGNLLTGKTNTGGNVDQRVTDTSQASVGTPYNTDEDHRPTTITTADETIYHYVELKEGSAQPEGTVAEKTTTVQYVYAKAGSVVIRYVKEDDNGIQSELQPNVLDEDNVKPGTPYDTTDEGNKPTTITTEDGKTYTLVRNEGHDETGEVAAGETKEITYVYKEVTGKVVVNFKSTSGETLQDQRTDTKEGSTGRDYNTEEDGEVPPTITKDGKTYKLVPNLKNGNPTGKVTPGTTEVTYYYEPVLGDVIIKYTDTEGNTLKDTVIDEDDVIVGTDFDTTNEGDKPEVITNSNGKYVLVPSLTTATDPTGTDTTETGKVLEGTTTITYVYQKVANWIPLIPNVPENERPKTEYPFDPTDPDKEIPSIPTNPTTDQPVIPHVPGYTPVDPKDNTPLTPVDPEDPSKGYVPPTPETPGEDTLIPYVHVKGDVVIKYVDTDGNTLKDSVTDEDDVLAGTKYNTTDEGDKPTEIVRNGDKYVLVPSKTTAVDPAGKSVEETGNVVEGTTTITYVYQKVANWIPLIPNVPENKRPKTEYPFDPTEPDKEIPSIPTNPTTDKPVIPHVPGYTPVDPKDNTPLKPVDPEDPSKGYVPPTPETPGEDTLIPYVPVKGDVVIKYVDTDGNTLKDSVTDEDDVLAGTKYNTTDEGDKPTEIVRNGDKYVLVPSKTTAVDPTGKSVEETGSVVEGTTTITYVYQKVANWIPLIPNVPENQRPKTEYPFDPTEPDKEIPSIPTNPTTDKPVIPHVPGYTPVDPKDNTPLTPVDPEDPSKGYVPPTPETPGEDTLIPYVPVKGDVVINYVDTDGNILKSPVTDEDDVLAGTKYDTTDEGDKPTEIVRNGDKYVLVPSKTTAVDPAGKSVEETGSVVEGTTTITYVYQKVANWIPLIPNVPENKRPKTEYPFDPTEPDKEIPSIPTNPTTDKPVIPHVPGYTPVDPKDNTPLTPVDPEDPSKGYVPPTPETPGVDTLIPYVPVKGDVVINYVDTDGNILKSPVTDEDDVLAGTKYDTTDEGDKPTEIVRNGDKYVLVPSKTTAVDPTGKSVEETGSVVEGKTTITYVYQKVANWIPLIPNVPENERPKTEYPFDPTEPDKEIPSIPTNPTTDKPVIPHVPGYTPVDPKDNTPLTPVDPEDPSKGYIPPTPETPGEDTLIPYVPIKNGTVIVTYITE
ncbi:TPA: MucBP domain-containing protein, partial [Streptococcus suis]